MRKPCKNCPFRLTAPSGWLGEAKATEIVNAVILSDNIFHCHKTVDYSKRMNGSVSDKTRPCAGSILLANKSGNRNWIYRILSDTVSGERLVFASTKKFIDHHKDE